MQFDLATLIQSLALLILAALGVIAWQWLRIWRVGAAINQQQSALDQLAGYARVFVRAAEQIYIANPTRLQYVLDQLKVIFPDLDEELVRAVVEAAVNELKAGPAPAAPPQPVNCEDLAAPATKTASTPPAKVARSQAPAATPTARP